MLQHTSRLSKKVNKVIQMSNVIHIIATIIIKINIYTGNMENIIIKLNINNLPVD